MPRQHMSDLAGRLFPASFVGSYPRPSWYHYNLGDRDIVAALRDQEFADAYRDGIRAQIGDQEEAGLDILADPHLWYDKHQGFISSFGTYNTLRFDGTEARLSPRPIAGESGPAWREAFENPVDMQVVVTGKLGRGTLHHWVNWSLAQRCTEKPVKAFFAMGPVELVAMTLVDEHYHDRKAMLLDLAEIFHAELKDAVAAGARIVELDDLVFHAPREEWGFGVEILNRVFHGIDAYKVWHCCHGGTPAPINRAPYVELFPYVKDLQADSFDWSFAQTGFPDEHLRLFATPGFDRDLGLGVISNKNYLIETPEEVAAGIKKALQYVAPERIHLTSDCGLFAYSRTAAKAKLTMMARGAALARQELAASTGTTAR